MLQFSSRARTVLLASLAMLLLSCGGSKGGSPSTPTAPTPTPTVSVTSVSVTGSAGFTSAGQTSQLTATATRSDGTSQSVTSQATWQSSDANIAAVSASGLVTARAAGTATISATYQNVTGRLSVAISIAPAIPNVTGTWRGQYFICCGISSDDGVMTWTLTHAANATSFRGTMTIVGDFLLGGPVTGSVEGAWLANLQHFTFVVSVSPGAIPRAPGCTMTFNQSDLTYHSSGAPTNGGPFLNGGFYGNFCNSIPISLGALQLVKQ